jgi:hypothetical protein
MQVRESFASLKCRKELSPYYRRAVRHLIDRYGDHLMGIHVASGPCGEHFSWDVWGHEPSSAWGTRNHYFYEVVNSGGESFKSWISVNQRGADPKLVSRFESLFNHASSRPKRSNWAYHVPFATSDCAFDAEMTEEEVFRQLDKQLERLMKFESRIAPLVVADFE